MARSPSPEHEPRKRGRIACVPCRQAKVRCDFVSIPCTRCAKLQIDCSVDPGFKRTNKRDKVNELEDNVQRLRDLVEKQQTNDSVSPSTQMNTIHGPEDAKQYASPMQVSQQFSPNSQINPDGQGLVSQRTWSVASDPRIRRLGEVALSAEETEKLFAIYFEKFHPHFPILNPNTTASEYYETSTPLFWSIISVALRSYKANNILDTLTPALCTHLWTEVGSSKKNVVGVDASNITEIQAMLLLAAWPMPNVRLWSDRSLIQSNLALTSAMHIGLHRPGFDFEYARNPPRLNEIAFQERCAAWIASYCLCVNLALEFGHVPLVPVKDWIINKVCLRIPQVYVPTELRHYAIVQRQANDAFQTLAQMNENPAAISQEPTFFAHMSLFEKALTDTESIYGNEMSLLSRIRLQGTLLLLQMMYFLPDQSLEESKQGLLRAYATATGLLSSLISEDAVDDFLATAPYIVLRIILRAAFTVLRVLFSSHGDGLDRKSGKILFDTAVLLLRQMSIQVKNDDQPHRVAEALKLTWRHMEKDAMIMRQPPALKIRSRLAASMQYDCLIFYRDAVKTAAESSKKVTQQNGCGPTLTPSSMTSNLNPQTGGDALQSEWSTPSFQAFLETDLSWLDDMINPEPFPGV